jgi:hypothetical protein
MPMVKVQTAEETPAQVTVRRRRHRGNLQGVGEAGGLGGLANDVLGPPPRPVSE